MPASPEILFVNMPPFESYFADAAPHLGMLYVMTSLRRRGHSVGYLDCSRRGTRRSQILDAIRGAAPRMVCFSVDTDNLYNVGHMSKVLKKEFGEDLLILLGGPASQGQPEDIMNAGVADVLVIGEGEFSACEVADALLKGEGRLEDVAGICYRTPEGLKFTAPRDPIENLDSVPIPDRDFLPKDHVYEASIITGRGCPFRCTFCFEGRMGNKYRHRSPENILREIESLVERYKRPFIVINDDTFTSDIQHTKTVLRMIRERFTPWKDLVMFCEVRVDMVSRHPELVEDLVSAGVNRIQLGVESADLGVLKDYKRLNVKPDLVEKVVRWFHEAGIASIYCGFIAGGPKETRETLATTMRFAERLLHEVAPGTFECNCSFLTPLAGTELFARPQDYGLTLLDPGLKTSSNFNFPVVATEHLSVEEINNFRGHFVDTIRDGVQRIIGTLPREKMELHIRLKREFNVSTMYSEQMVVFPRMQYYWDMVGEHAYEAASELPDSEILERFPTRVPAFTRMDSGRVTIRQGASDLTLSPIGTQVYGLCSGKLKGREIVDEMHTRFNGSAPPYAELQSDVISFVRSLDRNYALFLKDY